jgi:hypothetical protein
MARPNWSRPLPRSVTILDNGAECERLPCRATVHAEPGLES